MRSRFGEAIEHLLILRGHRTNGDPLNGAGQTQIGQARIWTNMRLSSLVPFLPPAVRHCLGGGGYSIGSREPLTNGISST